MTKTEKFVEQANKIHNQRYDYSLVEYTGAQNKVVIICSIHGNFLQTPTNHIHSKQGCPVCGREQRKITNLKRYGCKTYVASPKGQQERKQTWLEKYGVDNPSKNNNIKELKKQSHLYNYGVDNYNKLHMVDVLPLLENYDWMKQQYLTLTKTATQIADELKISTGTVCSYLKQHQFDIRYDYNYSYKSIQWITSIQEQENIHIQHALNGGEYKIPNTKIKVDGYCAETNTIYEFHGDYWHGNPILYKPDYINEITGKIMGELYDNTIKREHQIISLGYNLVVKWETDC